MFFVRLIFLCWGATLSCLCQLTPHGVPLSKIVYYKPNHDFTCIDGSATLSWSKVNDDYCDCVDGSDEPGTSACENGLFYCQNKGHKPRLIPSSRVDDFICDCCDGSDEPQGKVTCKNDCWQLGKVAREEAEARRLRFAEGHVIYENYIVRVKSEIDEARKELQGLEVIMEQLRSEEERLKKGKELAEAPESAAKAKFQEILEEFRKKREEARDSVNCEKAFVLLDENKNGRICKEELKRRIEIDTEATVTEEEVSGHLSGALDVDKDIFKTDVWPKVKLLIKLSPETEPEPLPPSDPADDEKMNDGLLKGDNEQEGPSPMEEASEPVYDDETKKLIEIAESARTQYNEIAQNVSQLAEKEKRLRNLLEGDYGPQKAFLPLFQDGQCFDFSDFEYTYTFCPFKSVTQTSKNDQMQTSLGQWGSWSVPYSQQVYDNGQGCWNGPARSTKVDITCDRENKVLKVEEPSRCLYHLTFTTPAVCHDISKEDQAHDNEEEGDFDRHTEL